MIRNPAITECLKKLLLWLFLLSAMPGMSCDIESFVFEEFGMRCQRIGNYIRDLQISRKMQLASFQENRRKLLSEWVSFYLDHGQSSPASFSMLIEQNWRRTINFAGETISQLAYEKIEPDQADPACIIFELISQPQKLETTMQMVASWSEVLNLTPEDNIEATSRWITQNMNFLIQINRSFEHRYSGELQNSLEFIAYFNRQWSHMLKAPAETAEAVFRFTRQDLMDRMKKQYERWRTIVFM